MALITMPPVTGSAPVRINFRGGAELVTSVKVP
jgi:hypothetical protein